MTPEERRKHYEQVKRKSQEEFGFKYANSILDVEKGAMSEKT